MKTFLLPYNIIEKESQRKYIFDYSNYISVKKYLKGVKKNQRISSLILIKIVRKIFEKIVTSISFLYFPNDMINKNLFPNIEQNKLNIISLSIEKIFINPKNFDIRFVFEEKRFNIQDEKESEALILLKNINEDFNSPAIKKIIKVIENENTSIFKLLKTIEEINYEWESILNSY